MSSETNNDTLSNETRQQLKELSKSFLRLHKMLLDGLVLDDPHFAWLRRMSALIALIDEATSIRRPASEVDAVALLGEAKTLLMFGGEDETFNDKFQIALQRNSDASLTLNDTLIILKNV
jgi:hypothetical protein